MSVDRVNCRVHPEITESRELEGNIQEGMNSHRAETCRR